MCGISLALKSRVISAIRILGELPHCKEVQLMKHIGKIFFLAALCLGVAQEVIAQKSEGQLTLKEQQETKRLLALFERRLAETLDVEQALEVVGAEDWFAHILQRTKKANASDLSIMGVEAQLLLAHEYEYRRALLSIFNFTHLMFLQTAVANVEGGDGDFIKSLPPAVLEVMRGNQFWAAAFAELSGETTNEEGDSIRSLSDLISLYTTTERASEMLRTCLQTLDAKDQRALEQRIEKEKQEMGSDMRFHLCNDECAGLPNGTRTAVVNYLLFQLTFAKVGDEMRLVLIASRIGD